MKKEINHKKIILDYALFIIGSILLALAISSILRPSGLIVGGATGISILLEKVTNIKYTYIYYAITISILLITYVSLGKKEVIKILLFSAIFPPMLIFFDTLNINFIQNDMLLSAVYFGIMGGIACGLVFKSGFSQGGTDTLAKIIHLKLTPFIGISQIFIGIDIIIIVLSAFIFDKNIALYGILAEVVMMKSMDAILIGSSSKQVEIEIISEKYEEISEYILNTIVRGISMYEIKGGYTEKKKTKIVSICSPKEIMLIKKFVAKTDSVAFMSVSPVSSVWGKGAGFESLVE